MTNKQAIDLNQLVSNPASPYYNVGSDDFGLPNLKETSLDKLDYERQLALERMQRDLDAAAEEQLYEQDEEVRQTVDEDATSSALDQDELERHSSYDAVAQEMIDAGEVGPSEYEEDKDSDTGIWDSLFKVYRTDVKPSKQNYVRSLQGTPLEDRKQQILEDQYTHFHSNRYDAMIGSGYGDIDLANVKKADVDKARNYLTYLSNRHTLSPFAKRYSEQEIQEMEQSWIRLAKDGDALDFPMPAESIAQRSYATSLYGTPIRQSEADLADERARVNKGYLSYATRIADNQDELKLTLDKLDQIYKQADADIADAFAGIAQVKKDKADFLAARKPLTQEYLDKANAPTTFTDFDTYLYKLPGLMGSSSGALGWQMTSMASGMLSGIATTVAVGAGLSNPVGWTALAAGVGLAGLNMYSQVQSREQEALMEIHEKYKNDINMNLDSATRERIMKDVKAQQQPGVEESEDEIMDKLLSGEYITTDSKFHRIAQQKAGGLSDIYTQNMALSAVDLAQVAVDAIPYLKVAAFTRLGKPITDITQETARVANTVNRAIENLVTFGLANDLRKAGTRTYISAARELAGRTAFDMLTEAHFEEGPQMLMGDEYSSGKYNGDMSYLQAWWRNFENGIRSINGFFNPFSELYNNEEHNESVKSAYLLSAFMSGIPSSVQAAYSVHQQASVNKDVAEAISAQYHADRAQIATGIRFAELTKRHSASEIDNAFQFIEDNKLSKGIPSEMMEEQRERLLRIANMAQSQSYKDLAESKGIDPESADYSTWIALGDYYSEKAREKRKEAQEIQKQIVYPTAILNPDGVTFELGDRTFSIPQQMLQNEDGNAKDPAIAIAELNLQIQQSILEDAISNVTGQQNSSESFKQYLEDKGLKTPKSAFDEIKEYLDSRKPKQKATRAYKIVEATDAYEQAVAMTSDLLLLQADQNHYQKKVDDFFGQAYIFDKDGNLVSENLSPDQLESLNKEELEANERIRNDIEQYKASVKADEELQTALEEEARMRVEQEEIASEEVDATDNNVDPETGEQVVVSPVDEQPVEESYFIVSPVSTSEEQNNQEEPTTASIEETAEESPESGPELPTVAPETETATLEETVAPAETPEEVTTNPAESGNASVNADEQINNPAERPVPTNPSGNVLVTDERKEELLKRLREKRNQLNAGFDPEFFAIGTELALYYIERGVRKFSKFASEVINALGDQARDYAKSWYNGARDLPGAEEFAKDMDPYETVAAFDIANFNPSQADISTPERNKHIADVQVKPMTYRQRNKFIKNATALYEKALAERQALIAQGVSEEELPELPVDPKTYAGQTLYQAPKTIYSDETIYGATVNAVTLKLQELGQALIPVVNPHMEQIYYNLAQQALDEGDQEAFGELREHGEWKRVFTTYNPEYEYFFGKDLDDYVEAYAEDMGASAETIKLAEAYLDLFEFKQKVIEVIHSDGDDVYFSMFKFKETPEQDAVDKYADLLNKAEIALQEFIQSRQKKEENQLAQQTIPTLSKDIYYLDGLFGTYEENKPFIENSGKMDFLESDMEFTMENGKVYLIIKYNGDNIKVQFAENYGRGVSAGLNYTEHNAELVQKIKILLSQGKKVVPVGMTRFSMDNSYRQQGDPNRYQSLTSVPEFGISDVYAINQNTLQVGVGHRDGLHVNGRVIQTATKVPHGGVAITYNRDGVEDAIILHTRQFSEQNGIAELLADVLLNIEQEQYNGLPISANNLLQFITNFGPHTVPQQDRATNNSNLLRRQAYFSQEGVLVISGKPYKLDEVRENAAMKADLVETIRQNLVWKVSEAYLNKKLEAIPPLRTIANHFKLHPEQTKVTIVPDVLEFTREQFDKGITLLGWYVQNEVISTNFAGFKNAKLRLKDATVADNTPITNSIQPEETAPVSQEVLDDAAEAQVSDLSEDLFGDMSSSFGLDKRVSRDQLREEPNEELELERQWLKDTFGLTDEQLRMKDGVVREVSKRMVSVGMTVEDGIILSRLAPSGTGFHEAFHRMTNLLVDDRKREQIYKAARRRLNRPTITDVQLDEILADEYAAFMLDEGIKLDYNTKNLFKKLKLWWKLMRNSDSYTLAKLMYQVGKGQFKDAIPSAANKERFRNLPPFDKLVGARDFKAITSNSQVATIVDGLMFGLLRNVTDLNKVSELTLAEFAKNIKEKADKSGPIFKDIADNWDFFEKKLIRRLKKLDVIGLDKKLTDQVNDEIDKKERHEVAEYTSEVWEESHYHSAPKEVKFFFSRIPMVGYDVDGNARVILDPSTNFPRIVNPAVAWNTALNDLHLCDSIESIHQTLIKLSDTHILYKPIRRQFEKYLQMSKSSDKNEALIADTFLTKLLTTIRSHKHTFITGKIYNREGGGYAIQIIDNGVDMLSRKYPSIWSANLVGVDPERSLFVLTEQGVELSSQGVQQIAKARRAFDRLVSALNGNGILTAAGKQYDLHEPQNLDRAKNQIVNILNVMGITIDKNTIEETLRHPSYGTSVTSQYDRFKSFVVSELNYGGLRSVFGIFGSGYREGTNMHIDRVKTTPEGKVAHMEIPIGPEQNKFVQPLKSYEDSGFVKFLAAQYVKTLQNTKELRSIGAQGNLYYPISQNNYASDHVNELNERGQVFQQLKRVRFSEHSLILSQMEADPDIALNLETLVAFRTDDSRDQGRDYFDITDKEDYITKMALTHNDRIVFPTVGDKKTWHSIVGIKLFHDPLRFSSTKWPDGTVHLDALFSNQVTDQFMLYALDELHAIEQCIEQLSEGGLSKDQLIKNYHTANFYIDSSGIKHTVSPNGTRFRVFTGVWELQTTVKNGKTITEEVFINFNDPKKSAEDNLKTAYDHFFNRSDDEKRMMINKLLQKRVEEELDYLVSLGMISRPAGTKSKIGSMGNTLLDVDVISKMQKHYANAVDGMNRPVEFVRRAPQAYAIYNAVAEHVVNTIVSVREIENLFSGDPAYYRIVYDENGIVDYSSDKIKRLPMLTSTGKNNRVDFEDWDDDMYSVAELNDHEVGSQQYNTILELAYQGNLRRTVRNIHGDQALYKNVDGGLVPKTTEELEQEYAADNVKALAEALTEKEFKGYSKKINVADAAVYISPNMYRKLMQAIGEYSPEVEKAFELLTDPNTSISVFEKMELYSKLLEASLKPLKYMASGMRFEQGLGVPYFNKMALFPVFDFVATGDMKKMYERMTQEGNELDMIMFNSAVKVGSRDAHDAYEDGQMTDLSNLTVYYQSFKYIRQQLATDPHTHEEQMAGTQMLKVNLSNLELEGVYGDVTGQWICDQVMATLKAMSDKGAEELTSQFLNEDGTFNQDAFSKMLYEELADRDADINMLDGVSIVDGKLNVPLSALSSNNWLESILISKINKTVIDVNLPGGAFIQRSTFGLDATRQDVISDKMFNSGRKLNLVNQDGSMDSIVSINLFKHIIPGYKNKTFAQARQWLIDNGIIGDAATANAIGYRIPTQSQASISALRFADVLPEIMGDTIVLPEEFTALTGSDFDIDKLYVSRYQYEIYEDSDGSMSKNGLLRSVKKARRIEFDDSKSHAENSMDANKNRLIEAYLKVLTDKSRTNELKISIDNDTKLLKNVLNVVESNQETKHPATFSTYTPQYQEKIKAEYTTGKAGIGPMALNNAHHILTQLFNVRFSTEDAPLVEALDIVDTNRVYDRDGNRILSWLSALINAFVDIAKDPYIIRLNVNPWTYNMTTFMIRMGFGEKTFYLLSQPILKEMAQAVSTTKGKYGVDQSKTPYQLEQEAIKSVLDKYDPSGEQRKHYEGFGVDKVGMFAHVFNTDMLKEVFTNPQENKELFNAEQVRIYYAFKALQPYARALADLVKYSKVDTKKTGKTILQQQVFRNGMAELAKNPIFYPGDITRFFNNSFIERKTANSVDFLRSLMQGQLLSCNPVLIETANQILRRIGKQTTASEQLLNTIQNSIIANVKSDFILHLMSEDGVTYDQLLRGTNTLAHRLSYIIRDIRAGKYPDLLDPNGNIDNALLNYIQPVTSNRLDPFALSFIRVVDNTASNEDKNRDDIINSWGQLLNHPNKILNEFARDLIYYAFITSGDNPGANSFFWAVPLDWRKSSGYSDWMGMMTTSLDWSINDDLVYRNNIMNNDLVPAYDRFHRTEETTEIGGVPITTPNDQPFVGLLSRDKYPGLDYSVHGIMFGIRKLNDKKSEIRLNDGGFPKFIKIKVGRGIQNPYALYKLLGTMVTYDVAPGRTNPKEVLIPVYGLTSKKGYRQQGNVIVDYNSTGTLFENELSEFPQELVSSPAGIETMYKLIKRDYGQTFASDFRDTFTLDSQTNPVMYEYDDIQDVAYEEVSDNRPASFGQKQQEDQVSIDLPTGITAQYGVTIDTNLKQNWRTWQNDNPNGIVAYRVNFNSYNTPEEAASGRIGNPFSEDSRGADTVEKFFRWLVYGDTFGESKANEAYRSAIVQKILNTPVGSPILYYKELERPSHATIIGYLINNKHLLQQGNTQQTTSLPTSDQTINIWHGSKENADLSNLAIRPFTTEIYGEQVRVNSVEQAFQLSKLWESFDEMDEDKFNELEQKIMSETNPYEIKRLGRSFKMSLQTRSSWDDMSSDVMYKLIKESFQQNPDALEKLLATGDAVLTHNQEEGKWKTEFPRILMEVREELRETSSQSRQLSLFDNMSQEELNAIEKQKEEHNKKCNR